MTLNCPAQLCPRAAGPICQQRFLCSGDTAETQERPLVQAQETVSVTCCRPGQPASSRTYTFERVYGPAESQAAVFGDVRPLLTSLLDGYNVCIMAYGQTGSGKSYTMLGPGAADWPGLPSAAPRDPGVIPRAAEELFRLIAENPPRSPKVEVSIVEIYNNDIYDLLAKDGCTAVTGVRRGVVTTPEGRTEVPLLTCVTVTSAVEFVGFVHRGLQLRVTHPTLVHADSSRSHLVVTATLTTAAVPGSTGPQPGPATRREPAGPSRRRRAPQEASVPGRGGRPQARLQLVDLAGSECVGASGVTGVALREASSINRSLAALADVLGALSEGRSHVPYRNSKLTRLLQDSIGGDAKLLLLLCVSPGPRQAAETLRSLGLGARARRAGRGGAAQRPSCSPMAEAPLACRAGRVGPGDDTDTPTGAGCGWASQAGRRGGRAGPRRLPAASLLREAPRRGDRGPSEAPRVAGAPPVRTRCLPAAGAGGGGAPRHGVTPRGRRATSRSHAAAEARHVTESRRGGGASRHGVTPPGRRATSRSHAAGEARHVTE
ncbi:kinesin-like protein KIF25 [Dipodomys spectabilis]|uniref:kinesin-like protein KIF25 n=1 Tax=Dipodomys spectabilis TaxID=105255 RepID=UPI001C5343E9|nr:kinesin-like protein KIF25 [Dipodomys spectabilis]